MTVPRFFEDSPPDVASWSSDDRAKSGRRERLIYSRWSSSFRVAKRGGQSSWWLSEWARIKASVHNWKKWLRSLNPNSRTTRSSLSRFSRRTLVVRFGLCCNLAVEEFSMARRCSRTALRGEQFAPLFKQPGPMLCRTTVKGNRIIHDTNE
jgi:hypothetical protein